MAEVAKAPLLNEVAEAMGTNLAAMRRASGRMNGQAKPAKVDPNPDTNSQIVDGQEALRASPDAEEEDEKVNIPPPAKKMRKAAVPATPKPKVVTKAASLSSLSDLSDVEAPPSVDAPGPKPVRTTKKTKDDEVAARDPEADDDEEADPEEIASALARPPPVNSSYLPLPWKGRLGYACLCTYLRAANPPVFTSRTCRIASILENRHPLKDPTQPPHATKNRPDKEQAADIARGQAYVEGLGLANARDIPKMLRWNDKYGIKFLRLSSEMFPFASHDVYGYKLAPFASEVLAEAGKVAAELGHRLSTHPGQFTQLGSPRQQVIDASFRDLEYHDELLSLLKLPLQQNRDAVMILHMGGVFGDKAATLQRFRENYAKLSQSIKNRIVLENDDVCYSVHDLLPICEELNIPLCLDYHHHNIIFDQDKIREGTLDIINLYDRIKATWTRKEITQKMHYSEPTPSAITGRQRRKHNPRVATLPPCAPDMDLMIEAKDKEQAVFELMKTFKLPGFEKISDIRPYMRDDENKPWKPPPKKKTSKKRKGQADEDAEPEPEPVPPPIVPEEDISMGGPDGRVYWPPTMEEWLRPKKREVKKKDPDATPAKPKKAPKPMKKDPASTAPSVNGDGLSIKTEEDSATTTPAQAPKDTPAKTSAKNAAPAKKFKNAAAPVLTPSTSDAEDHDEDFDIPDVSESSVKAPATKKRPAAPGRRQSSRGGKKAVNYADRGEDD